MECICSSDTMHDKTVVQELEDKFKNKINYKDAIETRVKFREQI